MFDSEIYNTKFPISVQTTFKPSTSDLYSLIINFTYTILYFNFMYMVTHKKWVFETSVFKPEKRPYRPNHWISLFYRRSSFAILSKFFATCVGVWFVWNWTSVICIGYIVQFTYMEIQQNCMIYIFSFYKILHVLIIIFMLCIACVVRICLFCRKRNNS